MSLGFFGKLPAHGDFIERHWPAAALAAWDDWLQKAIAISREQLGESWLDVYLTSPLWRFGLSAGCVDNATWLGVLMPSVDSVGRYFPLVLGGPLASDSNLLTTFLANETWFAELERLALAALDENLRADALEQRLLALAAPVAHAAPAAGNAIYCAKAGDAALADLLEWRWRSDNAAASLWSSGGSQAVRPGIAMARGLPPAAGYSALLDGNWARWGWSASLA